MYLIISLGAILVELGSVDEGFGLSKITGMGLKFKLLGVKY